MKKVIVTALACLPALGSCRKDPGEPYPRSTAKRMEDTMETSSRVPSVAELSAIARKAASPTGFGIEISLLLPSAWPPVDGQIGWYAYKSEALPTGAIAYRIHGPTSRISMRLPDGPAHVQPISDDQVQGRDRSSQKRPEMGPAEQVLLDVVMGRRSPDSARADLAPYLAWAAAAPVIGPDVRKRCPEFFAWLPEGR